MNIQNKSDHKQKNFDQKFFDALGPDALFEYSKLVLAGYEVTVWFNEIRVVTPTGKILPSLSLLTNSTAVVKGVGGTHLKVIANAVVAYLKKCVAGGFDEAKTTGHGVQVGVPLGSSPDPLEAGEVIGPAPTENHLVPPAPTPAQPVIASSIKEKDGFSYKIIEVIPLKDAKVLGQQVKGTGAGSVYTVVGIGARFNMAVREAGGKLSVRVEGKPNNDEVSALVELGLSSNKGHFSAHFQLESVPAYRVLGAILLHPSLAFVEKVATYGKVTS